MKITSNDKSTVISISRVDDNEAEFGFIVKITYKDQENNFSAMNDGLHFSLNWKHLFDFFESRESAVKIELTEDCFLKFFRWNGKGDVGIEYKIGKYLYQGEPSQTTPIHLSGSFMMSSADLFEFPQRLKQLIDF